MHDLTEKVRTKISFNNSLLVVVNTDPDAANATDVVAAASAVILNHSNFDNSLNAKSDDENFDFILSIFPFRHKFLLHHTFHFLFLFLLVLARAKLYVALAMRNTFKHQYRMKINERCDAIKHKKHIAAQSCSASIFCRFQKCCMLIAKFYSLLALLCLRIAL